MNKKNNIPILFVLLVVLVLFLIYTKQVNNFRINSNVIPGDQIIIDAKVVNEKLNSFKFESTCHVNDKLVAKAEFLA